MKGHIDTTGVERALADAKMQWPGAVVSVGATIWHAPDRRSVDYSACVQRTGGGVVAYATADAPEQLLAALLADEARRPADAEPEAQDARA